jgi:hypothetical protein
VYRPTARFFATRVCQLPRRRGGEGNLAVTVPFCPRPGFLKRLGPDQHWASGRMLAWQEFADSLAELCITTPRLMTALLNRRVIGLHEIHLCSLSLSRGRKSDWESLCHSAEPLRRTQCSSMNAWMRAVHDPVVDSPYALFGELGFLGIGNRDNSIRELPSATLPNDFKICPSRYHLRGVLRYGGFRRIQAHSGEAAVDTASLLGIRSITVLPLKGL